MPQVTITAYGGVGGDDAAGEIGGNRILVEWDGGRWFFDFGSRFSVAGRYYEEFLRPRASLGLRDFLRMGLLPPLQGLYRHDLSSHDSELWAAYAEDPTHRVLDEVNGILLSHGHLDHNGAIGFLEERIPVYTGLTTAITAKAMQDIRPTSVEGEFCYLAPKEADSGVLRTSKAARRQRKYIVCEDTVLHPDLQSFWCAPPGPRTKMVTCPLELWDQAAQPGIRFWRVDHSIPGSGAFGIDTPCGWIIYSGDVRRHGFSSHRVDTFVEEARDLHPSVLVVEGTRVEETHSIGEPEVRSAVEEAIGKCDKLVIADFGPRNIERLRTFHDAARTHNRRLAITIQDAYLLDQLSRVDPAIPSPAADSICVLREPAATERIWARDLFSRFASNTVDARDVRKNPAEYVLCLSFWDIDNLVDIDPDGGLYIYSSSEAYTEDQAIDQRRLINWLDHFGLNRIGGLPGNETGPFHASGHADGPSLEALISDINPELIVPVHTESLRWFEQRWPTKVRTVKYGQPLVID